MSDDAKFAQLLGYTTAAADIVDIADYMQRESIGEMYYLVRSIESIIHSFSFFFQFLNYEIFFASRVCFEHYSIFILNCSEKREKRAIDHLFKTFIGHDTVK